jgi:hypothetical protein
MFLYACPVPIPIHYLLLCWLYFAVGGGMELELECSCAKVWIGWYDYSSTDSSFHPLIPFPSIPRITITQYNSLLIDFFYYAFFQSKSIPIFKI